MEMEQNTNINDLDLTINKPFLLEITFNHSSYLQYNQKSKYDSYIY